MIEILGEKGRSVLQRNNKMHENILRGSLEEINSIAKQDPNLSRGELVISLEGVTQKHEHFHKRLRPSLFLFERRYFTKKIF